MPKFQEKQLKVAKDLKRNTWATNKITTIKRKVISDPPPVSDKSSSGCCSAAAALRQHTGSSGAYNATTKQDGRADGRTSNGTHPCLHEYAASTVPLATARKSHGKCMETGVWRSETFRKFEIARGRGPKLAQNPAPGGR